MKLDSRIPDGPLAEDDQLPLRQLVESGYVQSKWVAEKLALAARERGLPVAIYRVTRIWGHSATGAGNPDDFLFRLLKGCVQLGGAPDLSFQANLVPVDYVARALVHLSGLPEAAGRVFHLSSGPDRSLRVSDLAAEVRRLLRADGVALPPLRRLQAGWVRHGLPLVYPLVRPRTRRMLRTLPYFLDYLAEEQVFDNTQAQAFCSPHGLRVPEVRDYLPHLIRYYRAHRPAPAARSAG